MKQSNNTTSEFESAATAAPEADESLPLTPVTKARHDEINSQLSTPRIALEYTPTGPATAQIRTENDQRIAAEMAYIRSRLDKRRNQVKAAFSQAHDGPERAFAAHRRKV